MHKHVHGRTNSMQQHNGLTPLAFGDVALSSLIERRLEARLYALPSSRGAPLARVENGPRTPASASKSEGLPSIRTELSVLRDSRSAEAEAVGSQTQGSGGHEGGSGGHEGKIVAEVCCAVHRVVSPNSRWLQVLHLLQDKAHSRSLLPDLLSICTKCLNVFGVTLGLYVCLNV